MKPIELFTYQRVKKVKESLNIRDIAGKEVINKINWGDFKEPCRIGIIVGSRGINNISTIVKTVVDVIKEKGHSPVIVPAMGSHGGGTSEGQLMVLASLGITSETMGCPIESSIDTEIIDYIDDVPVHVDKIALTCQGLILINRIKAHTSFSGIVESGILKMAVIGLGNPVGAALIHSYGPKGLQNLIPSIGKYLINKLPIILGLALIENEDKEICLIQGLRAEEIFEKEQGLLKLAKAKMAKLPISKLDILIVEEMGKCFSGTGIDTNIIGRLRIKDVPEPKEPDIERIIVLNLAEASNGNATGIGLADFITENLVNKINWEVTYRNVITTTFTQRAMLPIVMADEKSAIDAAIKCLGNKDIENLRIMKIKNTLDLEEIKVSKSLIDELSINNSYILKVTKKTEFI